MRNRRHLKDALGSYTWLNSENSTPICVSTPAVVLSNVFLYCVHQSQSKKMRGEPISLLVGSVATSSIHEITIEDKSE